MSGSTPGLCGGVGRLSVDPVDDNLSEFTGSLTDSENGPVMAPADWGGAKDTEEVGSRSLADSENGPLMAPADWGGAKETEEVRAENGHLMAPADWGGAEEVEEAKESRPLASIPLAIGTLLVILGSATGYLVWAGGCQRVVSATIYLTSPGLAAVHGSAHSPVWVSAGGCRRTVSATIYFSSPGLAACVVRPGHVR
jgi:hypothetical protein